MQKIRTLTIAGNEYKVSPYDGIIEPFGKFHGERPHTVRDYDIIGGGGADEYFGDCTEWRAWFGRIGHRYYRESDQGFFNEITQESYKANKAEWDEYCEAQEEE